MQIPKKFKLKQEVSARVSGFNLEEDLVQVALFLNMSPEKATKSGVINEAFQFVSALARQRNEKIENKNAVFGFLTRNLLKESGNIPISMY